MTGGGTPATAERRGWCPANRNMKKNSIEHNQLNFTTGH